jgi:hypothetical protein
VSTVSALPASASLRIGTGSTGVSSGTRIRNCKSIQTRCTLNLDALRAGSSRCSVRISNIASAHFNPSISPLTSNTTAEAVSDGAIARQTVAALSSGTTFDERSSHRLRNIANADHIAPATTGHPTSSTLTALTPNQCVGVRKHDRWCLQAKRSGISTHLIRKANSPPTGDD